MKRFKLSDKLVLLAIMALMKLEKYASSVWRFFKRSIMPVLAFMVRTGFALFVVAMVTLFIVRAPAIHQDIIRAYVGSRVVYVSPTGAGGGTAFVVNGFSTGKPYYLTNDHICVESNNGEVLITQENGLNPRWQKIIARSKVTDLCLVEAPKDLIGLSISYSTYKGERVQAVGHPNLMALTLSNIGEIIQAGPTVLASKADVKAAPLYEFQARCDPTNPKFRQIKLPNGNTICEIHVPSVFFTNVLIQPGNSGSPLVNFYGDVVGVISGVNGYGWGVAVSLGDIEMFLLNK